MSNSEGNLIDKPTRSGWDYVCVVVAFLGGLVSIVGSLLTYTSQAGIGAVSLWPLPGMILVDWAVLGLLGFLSIYASTKGASKRWLQIVWFVTGTLIPLFILGAFSIGLLVLVAFLFFVSAAIVLAVRLKASGLENFGLLMAGAICNLGVVYFMIVIGTSI